MSYTLEFRNKASVVSDKWMPNSISFPNEVEALQYAEALLKSMPDYEARAVFSDEPSTCTWEVAEKVINAIPSNVGSPWSICYGG